MKPPEQVKTEFFKQWLGKAVQDLAAAKILLREETSFLSTVGFHCQQAAEKLLKALLSEFGIAFPRTHNLRLLMDLLVDGGYPLPPELDDLDSLTPFGTLFRYEDIPSATRLDRESVIDMVRRLRAHAVKHIRYS